MNAFIYLFGFVLGSTLFVSCSSSKSIKISEPKAKRYITDDFKKVWKYSAIKMGETIVPLDFCNQQFTVTIHADNTYEESYSSGSCPAPVSGTWKFDEESGVITIVNNDKQTRIKVIRLTGSTMVVELEGTEPPMEITYSAVQ